MREINKPGQSPTKPAGLKVRLIYCAILSAWALMAFVVYKFVQDFRQSDGSMGLPGLRDVAPANFVSGDVSYLEPGMAEVNERGVTSELPFDRLLAAARGGHVDSQLALGARYLAGKGVIKDEEEASRWFKAASTHIIASLIQHANEGDVEAMRVLFRRYTEGVGVPRDYDAAINWVLKVAEKSPPEDYLRFVKSLDTYVKYTAKPDVINKWLVKVAIGGNVKAQFALAHCLAHGDGMQVNLVDAYAWYNIAAAAGHESAAAERERVGQEGSRIPVLGQKRSRELLAEIMELKSTK